MMLPPRVLVTGLGLITGLGPDAETTWAALRQGRSAARWLDDLGPGFGPPFAGFPVPEARDPASAEPVLDLLARAIEAARADAGLDRESRKVGTAHRLCSKTVGSAHPTKTVPEVGFDPDRAAVLI